MWSFAESVAVKTYVFNGYHFDYYDSLPPFPTASQTFPVKYCKPWTREKDWALPRSVWSLDQQQAVPGSWLELQNSYPDTESGSAFFQDPQARPAR